MKTIQKRWLPLFLLAAVTFLFPACEGNNPSIDGGDNTSGLIIVKMRNRDNGATEVWLNSCWFGIDSGNNFYTSYGSYGETYGEITDVGKKKMSTITSIPNTGWSHEVAVIPQHSYVIRVKNPNESIWKYYYKLYVVEYITSTSGGIIGAEVQYCEWTPEQ